jgi:hypothetical protein
MDLVINREWISVGTLDLPTAYCDSYLRIGVGTSELQHKCIDFFRVDVPSRSNHK